MLLLYKELLENTKYARFLYTYTSVIKNHDVMQHGLVLEHIFARFAWRKTEGGRWQQAEQHHILWVSKGMCGPARTAGMH